MNTEYLLANNLFMNIFSAIIFVRIMGMKKISTVKKILFILCTIVASVIYIVSRKFLDMVFSNVILIIIQAIMFKYVSGFKFSNTVSGVIISYIVSYFFSCASALIEFPIQILTGLRETSITIIVINIMIKNLIQCLLVFGFVRLKKIKNGLNFLTKENNYVEFTIINVCCIFLLVQGLISSRDGSVYKSLLYYYIAIGIGIIYMIQRTIVLYYKQKLINDTIDDLKLKLSAKDKELERLTEENYKVHKVNHEFYNRQKALEKTVREIVEKMNMEVGEELSILGRIEELTKEHSKSMESIRTIENIKKTEIAEVDEMFSYMLDECNKIGIEFNLKVEGNIFSMVNNLIPKEKLVTLIGDHIRDAIIAVNSSNNVNKRILSIIGKVNDNYEFCVFDSGIEFDANVLDKLGEEQITTHKDDGGSGIGFITTFETMKECKASLEIEEIGAESKSDYTKSVKIVFDGNNEYRIISYRAEELEKSLNKNRIKIKKIE